MGAPGSEPLGSLKTGVRGAPGSELPGSLRAGVGGTQLLATRVSEGESQGAPGSEPPGSLRFLDGGAGPRTVCACPPGGPPLGVTAPPATLSSAALDSGHPGTWAPTPPSRAPSNCPGMEGSSWRENPLYREHSHTSGGTHTGAHNATPTHSHTYTHTPQHTLTHTHTPHVDTPHHTLTCACT